MDNFNKKWERYRERSKDNPPGKLIIKAEKYLDDFSKKDIFNVLDLGAGALVDSKYLLRKYSNANITAVDGAPIPPLYKEEFLENPRLKVVNEMFENYDFPDNSFHFINASLSLPFLKPERFNEIFDNLKKSLKEDGVLAATFLGEEDEWFGNEEMTFLSFDEAIRIFDDMEILEKDEFIGKLKENGKNWHILYFIAKK